MSCSGIKCRNTGSGYEKQSAGVTAEMDTRMKDLLAARAADDARIWGKRVFQTQTQTQTQLPVAQRSVVSAAEKPANIITYH